MTTNAVLEVAAANSADALQRFAASLQYETDCWDVHEAFAQGDPGFVLFDVRTIDEYQKGHIAGAIHMMRGKMIASKLNHYPPDTLFVTYCAGAALQRCYQSCYCACKTRAASEDHAGWRHGMGRSRIRACAFLNFDEKLCTAYDCRQPKQYDEAH